MSSRRITEFFVGPFLETYLAWATNARIRRRGASGGVATALLKYLLDHQYVDAVLVPKPQFYRGLVYGVWTVVRRSDELEKFAGSLYAPTFGFGKVLNMALTKFGRIAVTAVSCYAKAAKRLAHVRGKGENIFIVGLYCNNTPSVYATKYALTKLHIRVEDVISVSFRGWGWPGYAVIKRRDGFIRVPSRVFLDSGFGQYFYGKGCYLCSDHTNTEADLSLADPWTLPHEIIRSLGGATLVVVRTRPGLKVFRDAIHNGYINAVEINPIYAVQFATLLKSSIRILSNSNKISFKLPSGFSEVIYELDYHIGKILTSRESLWPLLNWYHKAVRPLGMLVAGMLDFKLNTSWARILNSVNTIQQKVKILDRKNQ